MRTRKSKKPEEKNTEAMPADDLNGGKRQSRYYRKSVVLGLCLLGVIVIAALVWIGIASMNRTGNEAESQKPGDETQKSATSGSPTATQAHPKTPQEKYHYYADKGKYAAAEKELDAQLAKAKSKDDKYNIYLQQAGVAAQLKHYSDAKAYVDKAIKLEPNTTAPYTTLANIAEAQGNKKSAISYWKKALKELDHGSPRYDTAKQYFESNIKRLQQ
jgi:tetratricopeptide (TPR) repeat protein